MPLPDRIYIAACAHDARYTRICVASVRYFYPDIPIRLLVGGTLQRGLAEELRRYWNVGIADVPGGDYGWGFVKLEPLFGPPGERFLVLDSDTVITGPVLDLWAGSEAPFLVDDEVQTEKRAREIYYDWQRLCEIDPPAKPPRFLFNTGEWFGTAGVLKRDDFSPWMKWTVPRETKPSGYFQNGEQGILNYVLNKKAAAGELCVDRGPIMRWPGHSLNGLDVESVSAHVSAPRVIHWAGMKRARLKDMVGADLLSFFEKEYYRPFRAGDARRVVAGYQDSFSSCFCEVQTKVKLASRKLLGGTSASG